VAVLGSLEVDGLGKVKLLDNDTRAQIKVVANDLDQLVRVLLRSTVSVDIDREGLSNADGVGKLNKGTAGETGRNERLGNPAADVGSGAVDLREVLARESATTVGTPAAVGVDNDLAAGQTGISLRTTNDEETRGLDLAIVR